jgi:Fe-S-cluster containining protein
LYAIKHATGTHRERRVAMNMSQRLALLKTIYDIHHRYVPASPWGACRAGCATCCTCHVTATTLEGFMVVRHLVTSGRGDVLDRYIKTAPKARFRPKITLNQMVAMCAQAEALPDEIRDPCAGGCQFRENDLCAIYPVRPFGCRAMVSTVDCGDSGEAQMPSFLLSVNNVIMQYLEAVDRPGGTGNLIDVLTYLAVDVHCEAYEQGHGVATYGKLLVNRSFPVLMVPPEHRQSISPLIQSLNQAVRKLP